MSKKTDEFLEKLTPCIEKGDLDACVDEASKLAEEMGISEEELLELSRKFGEEGKYDFAYTLAPAASRLLRDDRRAKAYYVAGLSAQYLKHYKKSEEYYKKVIELNPKDAITHNNYALLLDELGRMVEAGDHYKKAVETEPAYASAHNNYAIHLKKLGRQAEAEDHYKIAIELVQEDAQVHFNYAILLSDLGRRVEAEDHYKKAIELNRKFVAAYNNYANLLREQERFSEAESEVTTALQIEPSNFYALSTLGDILADEEYFEEAERRYREALDNKSSVDISAISEVRNNLGYVYFQLKQSKKAKKEFRESKGLSGNVKAVRNLRAIKKIETKEAYLREKIPTHQKCFAIFVILLLLGSCYHLFLFWETKSETRLLSDTMFVAQSSILMGLLIFALFADQLVRLKVGTEGVELEMSTEHRSISAEPATMLEHS